MKRSVVAAVILGLTTFALSAHAETPDELFERGRSLAAAQRYTEACPLFAESVRQEPGIGARLWLAECYEKTGRLASALAEFETASADAAKRHDERERVAARRASALEPRVPRIVVASTREVEITLDGAPVKAAASIPVDAGLHTIAARAAGFVPWKASVAVPDQPGAVTVNVPALEPVPKAAPAAVPAPALAPAPKPLVVTVHSSPGLSPSKIASIATGALGIAALGGGVFLGLQAKSTYDSSNQGGHCVNDACDGTGKDLRDSARSMATLSTIAFAGAGAAIASSIVLFVLSPSTSITPTVGTREAGLSLSRRF